MNSLERKELRYQRRKKLREDKIINKCSLINIDNCFKFSKVYYYAKKCTKNVDYKKSTINFKLHMFSIVSSTCINIKNNNYKVSDIFKFIINERSKERIIVALTIKDRLVHKVICDIHKKYVRDKYLIKVIED